MAAWSTESGQILRQHAGSAEKSVGMAHLCSLRGKEEEIQGDQCNSVCLSPGFSTESLTLQDPTQTRIFLPLPGNSYLLAFHGLDQRAWSLEKNNLGLLSLLHN